MVIAAHFLAAAGEDSLFFNGIKALVSEKGDEQFVFFVPESFLEKLESSPNLRLIPVRPAIKNGLMLHYWYRFKLAKLLKKYAVDLFITDAGATCKSTGIPQLLWVNDISFLSATARSTPFGSYWKRYFASALATSARVIAPQPFISDKLASLYPEHATKINFIPHGLDKTFQPAHIDSPQEFLDSFSDGVPYFLMEADQHTAGQLMLALKSFSLFKKRLKSSMKLVIMLHGIELTDYVKDFHLYKYRSDVITARPANKQEHENIVGHAYAALYLPGEVNMALARPLALLSAGVPLVLTDLPACRQIFDEAVLYSPLSEKSVAEHMMDLYKNEHDRRLQIGRGSELAAIYDVDSSREELWQTILWHASYKAH
jgi:glycosyltransferase involved in cell wall biosynthesis